MNVKLKNDHNIEIKEEPDTTFTSVEIKEEYEETNTQEFYDNSLNIKTNQDSDVIIKEEAEISFVSFGIEQDNSLKFIDNADTVLLNKEETPESVSRATM